MEDADLFSKAASLWGAEYGPASKQRVRSRGSVKEKKEAELFALRLWFSRLGGLVLIALMLFMVLYEGGENASLIITFVLTILFAVAMARFSTQPPWNLVATTAAYAAVLVVFGVVVFAFGCLKWLKWAALRKFSGGRLISIFPRLCPPGWGLLELRYICCV